MSTGNWFQIFVAVEIGRNTQSSQKKTYEQIKFA